MRRVFLPGLVVALAFGCGGGEESSAPQTPKDPPGTYQGKTTKQWLELFQQNDIAVRSEAGEALASIGNDEAADGLIAALKSDNYEKSKAAARYLGQMKAKADKVLPALEARTKHHTYENDETYRETVDTAIRKLKNP
jgi:HEAT repeat protein